MILNLLKPNQLFRKGLGYLPFAGYPETYLSAKLTIGYVQFNYAIYYEKIIIFSEKLFLNLHLNISNGSTKIYYKRDDFDLNIFNFQFSSFALLRCLYFATDKICISVKSRH